MSFDWSKTEHSRRVHPGVVCFKKHLTEPTLLEMRRLSGQFLPAPILCGELAEFSGDFGEAI